MSEKRAKIFLKSLCVCMGFLLITVFKIAVIDGKEYSVNAVNQRAESAYTKNLRGIIYDKNMRPLVEGRTYIDTADTVKYSYTKRYDDLSLARHIIGYTDAESNGVSGLEKEYDSYLKTDEKFSVNKLYDVLNNPIKDLGTHIVSKTDLSSNLKLTLDYHIQKTVEDEMDKAIEKGSVAVLDIDSFNVLALASRPNFNQDDITPYIEKEGTELVDRATSQYNAGSIFKIITMAAAIEENKVNKYSEFLCMGSKNIDGLTFNCHKTDGHMFLDYEGAFEKSCNCAFYELGIETGSEKMLEMAQRFGMGEKAIGLSWERCGNISTSKKRTRADAANLSIGQGDILLTPVQAAKIAAVIANDGISKEVNLVESVVDSKGKIKKSFIKENEEKVIEKSTAEKISKMMERCVSFGTGAGAKSDIVRISGKTGTAQTGWLEDGSLMVHGWFVGFFPSEKPEYAMAVFLENGQSSGRAARIFKSIAEKIMLENS